MTSWEAATELVREWEVQGYVGPPKDELSPSIKEAAQKFIADAKQRSLSASTLSKYELLLRRLVEYANKRGYRRLKELGVGELREFRATWQLSARTAVKMVERLRAFFRFCLEAGWVEKNPARALKVPVVRESPTLPFTKDEMKRILESTEDHKLRTFIHVLRYTGLRIGDASLLTADRIHNAKLQLYTQKTGTPVWVSLPPFLGNDLKSLSLVGGKFYFLLGESTRIQTTADLWRRRLAKVFANAKIEEGHPHRFRDTFAVELLLAGGPIERVSILLGHSSIRVTERSYAPWVQARQEQLEQDVMKTWEPTKLRLVSE